MVTGGTVAPVLHSLFVNVLLSSVTEPFRASARPSTVEAVLMVIEVKARIEPTKLVSVSRVAELPICQNTLHA